MGTPVLLYKSWVFGASILYRHVFRNDEVKNSIKDVQKEAHRTKPTNDIRRENLLQTECTNTIRNVIFENSIFMLANFSLRKHAYSNILKILPQKKTESFQIKFWYFSYFCSKHRLSVLVRTASVLTSIHNLCFWAEIRRYVYPCKSQFYYRKVGFEGVKII